MNHVPGIICGPWVQQQETEECCYNAAAFCLVAKKAIHAFAACVQASIVQFLYVLLRGTKGVCHTGMS